MMEERLRLVQHLLHRHLSPSDIQTRNVPMVPAQDWQSELASYPLSVAL
jgi:hypothetical protein